MVLVLAVFACSNGIFACVSGATVFVVFVVLGDYIFACLACGRLVEWLYD